MIASISGKGEKRSFIYLKERALSIAGREVLIKVVIQAIPTYTMSCFKLPKGLIKELEVLIKKFWWGYNDDTRKVHWVS